MRPFSQVLALVLGNPPPQHWVRDGDPAGSVCSEPSQELTGPGGATGEDRGARAAVKQRSTATLVVCAVSLVGQWIEEARSKLDGENRLRIHMYHGGKRIKNAKKLAEDFDLVGPA